MDASPPTCSQCNTPLPPSLLASGQFGSCTVCGDPVRALTFPAFFRKPPQGDVGERILVEGEAGCFYHPNKRASIPCDDCGRFLCPVCDIDFNGRHICPACLAGNQQTPGQPDLEHQRILYDSMALMILFLTTLIFCLWPFWILSGPIAIVLAVLSWSRPSSLIPRTRLRSIAAILLGLIQTVAGTAFLVKTITS